jgi:hypothetical protein
MQGLAEKGEGLGATNPVQQGAELAALIRHDPEFRGVRRASRLGKRAIASGFRRSWTGSTEGIDGYGFVRPRRAR